MNFQWSDPEKIRGFNGKLTTWKRFWIVPDDKKVQNEFWIYYKSNKIRLRLQGFSVRKDKSGIWFFEQTVSNPKEFKDLLTSNNNEKYKDVDFTKSELEKYSLKDSFNKKILLPYQIPITEQICSALNKHGAAINGSDMGTGKCHPAGTKVRSYYGPTINVEDVKVGDLLMGDDSSPRNVLTLCKGHGQIYKIVPTYGDSFEISEGHILTLYNSRTYEIQDICIETYVKRQQESTRYTNEWKLIRTSVEYKENVLDIDPYLAGLWIGDGLWTRLIFTFGNKDIECIDYIKNYCIKENTTYKIYKNSENSINISIHFKNTNLKERYKKYILFEKNNRFISDLIKYNSKDIRKKFLAGLIDSDGELMHQNGNYSIVTKYEKLAKDIVELSQSLGYGSRYTSKFKKWKICRPNKKIYSGEGTYHRVYIKGACDLPVLLERKKTKECTPNKNKLVTSFKVEKLNEFKNYYGFILDGNQRYLLEDFTITHNTYMAVALAREFNFKIGIVCPKAVISSWHRVINDEFKMSKQCVFVINYESLKTGNQKHIATWVKSSKTKKKTFTWKVPKDTLIIFDESQKIKGRDTKNAEIAIEAKKQGYKILLCSGTSAISPLELRAQGFILGLHKLSNFFPWLYEHGVSKGMYGLEFNNDETVLKKLHKDLFLDRGVRVKKEDIKDFPDCETIIDAFNLDDINTKKINQIYKDMQKELAFLKAKKKRDTSAEMVIRLRARQQAEILKVPLLVEMTEEALEEGYSVAIIVNFTDTIKALAERLKTKCIVWGDNKKTEREDNIASFQKDKDRVILVNIQAGGVGVSLHDLNGKHPRLSLISPNDSAVLLKQATGRIHRAGAKTKSLQKIVFIAGTEEEEVCKNVRSKIKNLDLINDGDLIIGKIF